MAGPHQMITEAGWSIEREQDDSLTEEQAAQAGAIVDAIDRLWEQDQAADREAYIAAVRQALTARGITVDVEAVDQEAEAIAWDPFTDELHEAARKNKQGLPA